MNVRVVESEFRNSLLESLGISADNLLNDLTALEEDKSRHGLDTDLGGDLVLSVDVNLVEAKLFTSRGVGDLFENGTDDLAGTAPGSPEVNDDRLVAVDERLEFFVGLDSLDDHFEV